MYHVQPLIYISMYISSIVFYNDDRKLHRLFVIWYELEWKIDSQKNPNLSQCGGY